MINSRASYDFVTFPDGVAVNGGIMPLRSGAAANAMRLEDVGFLYEAMCERQTAMGETANHATLTKEIRAYPLATVARGLTSLAPKFLQDFEPTKVAVSRSNGNTVTGIYGNASTAPTASFASGGPLVAADVKDLFGSVATMRQFEATGTTTISKGTTWREFSTSIEGRKDTGYSYMNANDLYRYDLSGSRSTNTVTGVTTWDGSTILVEFVESGTYSVDAQTDWGGYVDSVVAIAIFCEQRYIVPYGGESSLDVSIHAVPLPASISKTVVSVGAGDMVAAAKDIAAKYSRPGLGQQTYNIYSLRVYCTEILVLCSLGEHTKY